MMSPSHGAHQDTDEDTPPDGPSGRHVVLSSPSTPTQSHHLYSSCRHAKCGWALQDRNETKAALTALLVEGRPPVSNVYGNGPLLISDIPASCRHSEDGNININGGSVKKSDIVLGIDEAGRGSVLGPMVYGAAYWSMAVEDKIPRGFRDSKSLKEEDRFRLFDELLDHEDIGFAVRSLLPSEISRNMLRTDVYNLNEMSHDAAITLIRKILDGGVDVRTAYIDTVGSPSHYARKLEREFPGINFVVESKADAKYAPCSAASVGESSIIGCLSRVWRDHYVTYVT
jgi:ribonuclease HII